MHIFRLLKTIIIAILLFIVFFFALPKTSNALLAAISGDANGDGSVNTDDYVIWINNYNKSNQGSQYGDFNNSGYVDGLDYVIWLINYGTTPTTNPTETPIPTGPGGVNLNPFGTVNITTSEIEFNVNGAGSNIDSISFWEAADPTQSLMFVTSKANSSIEVYRYPFKSQLRTISCGSTSNGVWVDQERDVLYVTKRSTSDVCAYNLPSLSTNSSLSFTTAATSGKSEPNLTMLKLTSGQRRIYVSYDNKVYYHDAGNGNSLGNFTPTKGLETMYGDNYYKVIYIPDEKGRSGVYMYDANGGSVGSKFGNSTQTRKVSGFTRVHQAVWEITERD
jgi:hypothetical protein